MTITYLKKATATAETGQTDVRAAVEAMLEEIRQGGDDAVRRYAADLDKWQGDIVMSPEDRARATASVPQKLRDDISFAHDNIRRFAEVQAAPRTTDCEVEIIRGPRAGQRESTGVHGGVLCARWALQPYRQRDHDDHDGEKPPGSPISPLVHRRAPALVSPAPMVFAMDLCGADVILNLGGVQGVAAMANGLFGLPRADILVGPGNQYVAEAKRILYGPTGIDRCSQARPTA